MRRSTVCVAIATLAAAVAPGAQADNGERALAERYAPVVRLVSQDEPCAHGEAYQPTDVNLVLGNPDVAFRGPWDRVNIIKVAPTAQDLGQGLFDYHLEFPGHAVAPGCVYDEWSHRLNEGHVVYAVVLPYAAIATTYLYFDLRVAKQHEAEAAEAGEVLPVEAPPAVAPQ